MSATETMFANAARRKYRFPTCKGYVLAEDLFDMQPTQLNACYQQLKRELSQTEEHEDSLMETPSNQTQDLRERIEIVRFVFEEHKNHALAVEQAAAQRERKEQIMSIIHEKQSQALKEMSIEELQKLLDAE